MGSYLYPLLGAALASATSLALGSLVLRGLGIALYRIERLLFAFMAGSACLSAVVLGLSAWHLARKGVFTGLAMLVILLALRKKEPAATESSPAAPAGLLLLFAAVAAPFLVLYLFTASAPEVSADGSTYHLGNVLRLWAAHGLVPIHDIYGAMPEGLEMLFLFAFSIGRHPSAALVHLTFLIVLPLLLISYALRFGFPKAGFLAATLVFASPIMGKVGASAYNDAALAAAMFTVMYLMQLWLQKRDDRLLILAGLLAGFCFAIKYTGFIAIPYALALLAIGAARIRSLRPQPLLLFAVPCVLLILPWLIKDAVYMGNPLSPFFNGVFPNPYVSAKFERDYTRLMTAFAGTANLRELALIYTVSGKRAGGFFGPLFLLLPLGLASIRLRHGRHLLLAAAIFSLPVLSNTGTRFLIPAAPCVALAIGLAIAETPLAIPALIVLHAFASWPAIARVYCDPYAWRLTELPVRAVFDPKAAARYLERNLGPSYDMARIIERQAPAGSRIFCRDCPAQAYTLRDESVAYESQEGNVLGDALWTPLEKERQPLTHLTLSFQRIAATRLRVRRTNPRPDELWQVTEFRIRDRGGELPRSPRWKIHADPDPWEAPFAFDNSPVTKWSTEQYAPREAYLEVAFDAAISVDSVLLECAGNAPGQLTLLAEVSPGNLTVIPAALRAETAAAPSGMRRAAIRIFEAAGFNYLVMTDRDYHTDDYKKYPAYWGIRAVAETGGWTLYHLE